MIVRQQNINNIYDILNKPLKIYHSCWGKILSIEEYYGKHVVIYQTEPNADQEWSSVIFACESDQEILCPLIKEPKYLRSFLIGHTFIHIYTDK